MIIQFRHTKKVISIKNKEEAIINMYNENNNKNWVVEM
jgi:hypothetical protein